MPSQRNGFTIQGKEHRTTHSCHVRIINPGFDVERTDGIDDNDSVFVNAGNCIDEVVAVRPSGQVFAVPSLQG